MPREAPPNGGAPPTEIPMGPRRRVSEMQAKLHRWAAADPGRRFDDLVNFVYDPATLIVAFDRVAGNTGVRTAGVDGLTVADVEQRMGVAGFLDDLRAQLKTARSGRSRCGNARFPNQAEADGWLSGLVGSAAVGERVWGRLRGLV